MGCRMNKLPKPEGPRPGNIYSTLKRPQVETKTDVSYEYHFLDFTTLDNGIPTGSAIRISSLRDLPSQLQELYLHGFVLAAVHPFVQPTAGGEWSPLEQIFRAVLIKKMQRPEKPDPPGEACSLVVERCLSTDRLTELSGQPDFVKTVEDAASRGLKFVGIVHQYSACASRQNSPTEAPVPNHPTEAGRDVEPASGVGPGPQGHEGPGEALAPSEAPAEPSEERAGLGLEDILLEDSGTEGNGQPCPEDTPKMASSKEETKEQQERETPARPTDQHSGKAEIFAIFNKPQTHRRYEYYTVKVPIRICKNGQSANRLEANWLEHMTEHFKRGGSLVNTVFYPGMVNDLSPGSTEGVFIFEDFPEADTKAAKGYDAIVVEQITILEGARVQTDYVPLLNSLAEYGWQLTCVLPTPIVKTDSEGNLTTKQIVFLQRPLLPHKAKESKFPWRISKADKQGKKSRKSAKEKANYKNQQPPTENKIQPNSVENERNARVPPKCEAIEDLNPELRNEADGVTSREAEDFQEHSASSAQHEQKDSAQDMPCPSSPGSTQEKGTEECTANEEQDSQREEGPAEEEQSSQASTREMEEGDEGTLAEPPETEDPSN